MPQSFRTARIRRIASAAVIGLLASIGIVSAVAAPASAQSTLTATYPVNGSTFIKATNASLALGPGTLAATLDLETGGIQAHLTLPASTGSFTEFGVIPVTATAEFTEEGATTGQLDLSTGAVTSTSHVTIKLTALRVAGIPTPVGDHCQTESPATIALASGASFNVLNGGPLSGTYTIPKFEHCLLATPLINLTIPGGGNTIDLTLGPATIGASS